MWTAESRARHDRSKLRYPSDLTDDEWALTRPGRAQGVVIDKRIGEHRRLGLHRDHEITLGGQSATRLTDPVPGAAMKIAKALEQHQPDWNREAISG